MPTNIVEVMSSIQGEGMVVGKRQIFVRFAGCNLNCRYCDTKTSIVYNQPCQIERTPGYRDFIFVENPIPVDKLVEIVTNFDLKPIHSISFTGGEPLLQVDYLLNLLPLLKERGPQMYLETNGTLVGNLQTLLPWLDIISMDFKLPSCSQERELWSEHRDFLRVASSKEVFVKVVISAQTSDDELKEAASLVAQVNQSIPVILQPVTPVAELKAPEPARVIALQDICLQHLREVRVIPQTHKFINQL